MNGNKVFIIMVIILVLIIIIALAGIQLFDSIGRPTQI